MLNDLFIDDASDDVNDTGRASPARALLEKKRVGGKIHA